MPIVFSDPTLIWSLVIVAIVLFGTLEFYLIRRKRRNTAELRKRFGTEYERELAEHGSLRKAENSLAARETRVEKLNIRTLPTAQRDRFLADWQTVQSRFLDHPKGALIEADELVSALMQARGYPVTGFEQSAEDISVNHPRMMEYYRSAHSVAVRPGNSEATTEELRTAMIEYRHLFDELVQEEAAVAV